MQYRPLYRGADRDRADARERRRAAARARDFEEQDVRARITRFDRGARPRTPEADDRDVGLDIPLAYVAAVLRL